MYTWIWRHLPGGMPGRLAGSFALLIGALALLFLLIFPWAEPRLPFNNVTVDQNPTTQSPVPSPAGSPTVSP